MIYSLPENEYPRALPLVDGIKYALIVQTILEGPSPREVWVDDKEAALRNLNEALDRSSLRQGGF